jgi:tricorn protease-like protein
MPVPNRNLKYFTFFTKKDKSQYLNVLNLGKDKIEKKIKVPFLSCDLVLSKNIQRMAFCRYDIEGEDTGEDKRKIYFYENRSDKLIRVTNHDLPDYDPVFSPDEDFILYLNQASLSKTILKKYNIVKAIIEDVRTFSGTGYELAQWAENGLVLMINHNKNSTPFWLDMKTGKTKDINLERIYFAKASPDGKKLMYHQARKDDDSTWDLFVSDIDGKNPQMIAKPDNVDIFGVEWVNGK